MGAIGETVILQNGTEVSGNVLVDREDFLAIDLGYTVLTIPKAQVADQRADEDEAEGETQAAKTKAGSQKDLYFLADPKAGKATTVQNLVKEVGEAVVEVRTRVGLGSGFVIHPDGYLITNQHVIAGDDKLVITIFRNRGREFEKVQYRKIRIVAMDPIRDLALLKIEVDETEEFKFVPIAEPGSVRQGQPVFAIGSPLGLDRTVSQGIISLVSRVMGGSVLMQTTTQINPGNSGGPLFDLKGRVVGVNNRKAAAVGVEGLGFSIPTSVLTFFIDQRDAFAFDPRNPNAGFRYFDPPRIDSPRIDSPRKINLLSDDD